MLVCAACAQFVTFGPKGWEHVTAEPCPGTVIAWPEAVEIDDAPFEGLGEHESFDDVSDSDAA